MLLYHQTTELLFSSGCLTPELILHTPPVKSLFLFIYWLYICSIGKYDLSFVVQSCAIMTINLVLNLV